MANFMLVHGAWHGAWCWEQVVGILQRRGHQVVAPDLPGHGDDPTPPSEVTLQAYAERVAELLEAGPDEVQLVGHSLGGVTITAAAELCPGKVAQLIYLCAMVPNDGDTVVDLAAFNRASILNLPGAQQPSDDGLSVTVADEILVDGFYHDCSERDIELARERLCPQSLRVFGEPVAVDRGLDIPRSYIECIEDQAIHLVAQRVMARRGGCAAVLSLETSHSPFFSAPGQLADMLESLAAAS